MSSCIECRFIYTCTNMYIHVHAYKWLYVYVFKYIYLWIYIYVYMSYKYIYIYIYIYMYMYTQEPQVGSASMWLDSATKKVPQAFFFSTSILRIWNLNRLKEFVTIITQNIIINVHNEKECHNTVRIGRIYPSYWHNTHTNQNPWSITSSADCIAGTPTMLFSDFTKTHLSGMNFAIPTCR